MSSDVASHLKLSCLNVHPRPRRRYLQLFTRAAVRRGYRAVVYNRRGHGGTSLLPAPLPDGPSLPGDVESPLGVEGKTDRRDCGALTDVAGRAEGAGTNAAAPKIFPKHVNMDDMEAVVSHLRASNPRAPMFLIGFSCGANLCIHYLATSGEDCPFIAAGSVSDVQPDVQVDVQHCVINLLLAALFTNPCIFSHPSIHPLAA